MKKHALMIAKRRKKNCVSHRKSGFEDVQAMGDGLLMKLLLDGEETIVEAIKRGPQLFFEIEKS